jgi:hypothetical protein
MQRSGHKNGQAGTLASRPMVEIIAACSAARALRQLQRLAATPWFPPKNLLPGIGKSNPACVREDRRRR